MDAMIPVQFAGEPASPKQLSMPSNAAAQNWNSGRTTCREELRARDPHSGGARPERRSQPTSSEDRVPPVTRSPDAGSRGTSDPVDLDRPDETSAEPDYNESVVPLARPEACQTEAACLLKVLEAGWPGISPANGLPLLKPLHEGALDATPGQELFTRNPGQGGTLPGRIFLSLSEMTEYPAPMNTSGAFKGSSGANRPDFPPVASQPLTNQPGVLDVESLLSGLRQNGHRVNPQLSPKAVDLLQPPRVAEGLGLQLSAVDRAGEEDMFARPSPVVLEAATPILELEVELGSHLTGESIGGPKGTGRDALSGDQTMTSTAALGHYRAASDLGAGDPTPELREAAGRVIEQVREPLVHAIRKGPDTIHIRLKPEGLGEIHIDVVRRDNNDVTLKILATSQGARQVIEAGLADLKSQMQASGLTLNDVRIMHRDPQDDGYRGQNPEHGDGGNRRRHRQEFKEHLS